MAGLYLVTPHVLDLAAFLPRLEEALAAAPVECVLVAAGATPEETQRIAEGVVPLAQKYGAAALVADDTRISGRVKADGVHVTGGDAALQDAVATFRPGRIVGAGGIKTRHEAMEAAERDVDYVFFGLIDRADDPETHPRSLDLADWWMPLFQTPCVVLAGATPAAVEAAAATGADFIALRDAVWAHPDGVAAAMAHAARIATAATEPAA